ncbi:hypothetical protein JW710_02045 [Candidatus Dojkabacteria bacterium]|nr:hypothetical protein [Candidatus Dojkabacteria bacterium]
MSEISPTVEAFAESGSASPTVKVEYENMEECDALFQVDGDALGQALSEIGYSDSVLKPLVITDGELSGPELASYDVTRQAIVINQRRLVNNIRGIYVDLLERMGEEIPSTPREEKDFWQKFMNTKFFQTFFPAFWPYQLLKKKDVEVFAGDPERKRRYLRAAKEGELMPGRPIEEQRDRAKRFMGKLLETAMKRPSAWVLAHEYEHIHHAGRKAAVKYGLAIAPAVAGYFVLDAIGKYMHQMDASSTAIENVMVLGLLGIGAASIFGMAKGRAIEEQASYDAGYENFRRIASCFTINHDVFARDVLGLPQEDDR